MAEFEINPQTVTLETFQNALSVYNADSYREFSLNAEGNVYTLTGGDEEYCSGSLKECAFYWSGYVSGQMDGDSTYMTEDPTTE